MIRRSQTVPERRIPALATVTAVIYGMEGFGLLLATVSYTEGKNPRWVLGLLAAVGIGFAVTALLRRAAFTALEAEAMLAANLVVLVALALGSGIPLAGFSNGTALPLLAAYTGWFLTRRGVALFVVGSVAWVVAVGVRGESLLLSISMVIAVQSLIAVGLIRALRRRMVALAEGDPLTGVLNRHGLEVAAQRLIARAERRGEPLAVALIDVDDLRDVNNRHGHRAGDDLLVRASSQWRQRFPAPAAVGRVGGDEFVVLLPGLRRDTAEELLDSVAAEAPARWTAGVAELAPGESLDEVVERADRVMYNRKGGDRAARPDGGSL